MIVICDDAWKALLGVNLMICIVSNPMLYSYMGVCVILKDFHQQGPTQL